MGFGFAVKAPKAITHEAELRGGAGLIRTGVLREFSGMERELLGERLGPVLFQLPPKPGMFDEAVATGVLCGCFRKSMGGRWRWSLGMLRWFTPEVAEMLRGVPGGAGGGGPGAGSGGGGAWRVGRVAVLPSAWFASGVLLQRMRREYLRRTGCGDQGCRKCRDVGDLR